MWWWRGLLASVLVMALATGIVLPRATPAQVLGSVMIRSHDSARGAFVTHSNALSVHVGVLPIVQSPDQTRFAVDAHQAGQWNVAHISSATHVVGAVKIVNAANTVVTVTGTALDVNCTGCSSASVVSVSHVTSVTHVASASDLHVTLRHWGAGTSNTDFMPCHSYAAFVTSANAIVVHASGLRIYICGIVMVPGATAFTASLVEGTGSACGTGTVAILGSTTSSGVNWATNSSGAVMLVAPSPWLVTTTAGQNICVLTASRMSGVISYRGAP